MGEKERNIPLNAPPPPHKRMNRTFLPVELYTQTTNLFFALSKPINCITISCLCMSRSSKKYRPSSNILTFGGRAVEFVVRTPAHVIPRTQ